MVDAAAQQGAKDQVLVADSAGYLYFKDSGINYPVPVELDSISMLDSLDHKTGLIAVVKTTEVSFRTALVGFAWIATSRCQM